MINSEPLISVVMGVNRDDGNLYKSINILGFFIVLQIILGILTIIYGAQIFIASMHQISSIFLVTSCIYFFYLNTKFN